MKRNLLPVLALSLLLGACTTNPNTSAHIDTNPAVSAGIKDTKWGPLPSYEPAGHRFTRLSFPSIDRWNDGSLIKPDSYERGGHPFNKLSVASIESSTAGGVVKLDLLVNQDGTVRDVAILESSSDPSVDHATAAMFKKARYSLKLAPEDPAPYLVRFTMDLRMVRTAGRDGHGFGDSSSVASLGPRPGYYSPPPTSYSYSTSTP